MRISEREKLVAGAVQYRRSEPIEKLARSLGLKTHELQYALRRLEEARIIRPWNFINPFAIGFEEYEVLFTLGSAPKSRKGALEDFLRKHPRVIWFGDLGGSYQCGVRIVARRSADCVEFLDECRRRFGQTILRKSVAILQEFMTYPKRYLAPKRLAVFGEGVRLSAKSARVELDKLEEAVLHAMLKNPGESERGIARLTGHSRSGVSNARASLQEKGVLASEAYLVSGRQLGMQLYRVLIFGSGFTSELRQKIEQFAAKNFAVVNFTACLGEWEYELGIEVPPDREAAELVSDLYEHCGEVVRHVELIPVFEQDVSERFLDLM